jgi:hypothetical protein
LLGTENDIEDGLVADRGVVRSEDEYLALNADVLAPITRSSRCRKSTSAFASDPRAALTTNGMRLSFYFELLQ